jgi:transposase
MPFIAGTDRKQMMLPEYLDEYVDLDNPVRVFNAFVDSIDLAECGFIRVEPKKEGRSGFDPKDLIKLYVYGYYYGIRSSRKLQRETVRNMEVIWLVRSIHPDFRTIANFRRDNSKALKNVFKQFNKLCSEMGLFGEEYVSIDGTKIRAQNAKDNNFTLNKIDDRLKRLNARIEEYLLLIEKNDEAEGKARELSKEEIEAKIKELEERKARYEGYRDEMTANKERQQSLTDPESRLMKFANGGFNVGYNVQTAVDSKNKLISGFQVGNEGSDQGLLESMAKEVKEDFGLKTMEVTADKGYQDSSDLVNCLEAGIIPNVCPSEGKDGFDLQTVYEERAVSEEQKASEASEDVKACLRAGVIPNVYKEVITSISVKEQTIYEKEEPVAEGQGETKSVAEELAEAKEGYFVRDEENDFVLCPEGNVLRLKSVKKNGASRYCNKLACKRCEHKCTQAKSKEVDFFPGDTKVGSKAFGTEGKGKGGKRKASGTRKVVRFHLKVDRNKTNNRKCLSEHPFGTLKRARDGSYVLLKGIVKVTGEMALNFLGYNLKRVINIVGTRALVARLGC